MTGVNDAQHPTVPSHVRLELVHAYMQIVADACGADILHVKGAAIHPELSDGRRGSLDVDILVRPAHVGPVLADAPGLHVPGGHAAVHGRPADR